MTGITYPDSSLNTFAYDGDGKRLQKQDSTGTLRMVYDHQGPTGLYDLVKETDGSNTLVAFYTQGPMLISQRRGGNSYWYHDDALGSTSAITSSDETVTSTYKYYAFGDVLTSSGTLTNAFKFVGGLGYYSDPDSGLLLLRARYYWADAGRFVTEDPVREVLDLYAYAGNSPVGFTDPSGAITLHPRCETCQRVYGPVDCKAATGLEKVKCRVCWVACRWETPPSPKPQPGPKPSPQPCPPPKKRPGEGRHVLCWGFCKAMCEDTSFLGKQMCEDVCMAACEGRLPVKQIFDCGKDTDPQYQDSQTYGCDDCCGKRLKMCEEGIGRGDIFSGTSVTACKSAEVACESACMEGPKL
jgi:RHS repeat-associated protein